MPGIAFTVVYCPQQAELIAVYSQTMAWPASGQLNG